MEVTILRSGDLMLFPRRFISLLNLRRDCRFHSAGLPMYKISYNEKVIKLAHIDLEGHLPQSDRHHLIVHYTGRVKNILNYIDKIEKNEELKFLYILYDDVKQLKRDFFSQFKLVRAGGGLVINGKGEVLFIHRRGSWDLPKGKIEQNETKRQASIREVLEETGLPKVRIVQKLTTTYHIYRGQTNGRRILKPSHWYLMYSSGGNVTPQEEEDIVSVEWKRLTPKLIPTLIPIYSNIVDVLEEYLRLVN